MTPRNTGFSLSFSRVTDFSGTHRIRQAQAKPPNATKLCSFGACCTNCGADPRAGFDVSRNLLILGQKSGTRAADPQSSALH